MPANVDDEGYLEAEKLGLKHPAVRDNGKNSTYMPQIDNIAPRDPTWAPSKAPTNPQK